MAQLPVTVPELIELLEELIPEPAPRPGTDIATLMFEAGRRSVVRQLKNMRDGDVPEPLRQKRGAGRVYR